MKTHLHCSKTPVLSGSLALVSTAVSTHAATTATTAMAYPAGSVPGSEPHGTGSFMRLAEPAVVLLLMIAGSTVAVSLARRYLGFGMPIRGGVPERAGVRFHPEPGSGPAPAAGGAGGSDAASRLVPFPPSASDEPEWGNSGLRLGGHAGAASGPEPVESRGGPTARHAPVAAAPEPAAEPQVKFPPVPVLVPASSVAGLEASSRGVPEPRASLRSHPSPAIPAGAPEIPAVALPAVGSKSDSAPGRFVRIPAPPQAVAPSAGVTATATATATGGGERLETGAPGPVPVRSSAARLRLAKT